LAIEEELEFSSHTPQQSPWYQFLAEIMLKL
jgi:hypothetical protein